MIYIMQLGFYWYCGGYQLYIRVSYWHKAMSDKAKNETPKDRLAFLLEDKISSDIIKGGYKNRRDEQKMRKANGGSMPIMHA